MLKNYITALITPFKEDFDVDYESLEKIIKEQMAKNENAILINGTTAETPTLNQEERWENLKFATSIINKKVPIICGVGTNNTKETIEFSNKAKELGADFVLVVCPYYNKPNQNGLTLHFESIATNTDLPIILYNVPSRTVSNLEVETIIQLAKIDKIIGIKDAASDVTRVHQIKPYVDKSFALISGNDDQAIAHRLIGGHGIISVISNLVPEVCQEITTLIESGKTSEAIKLHEKFLKLQNIMFMEPSPAPLKYAMELKGQIKSSSVRLPLAKPSIETQNIIKDEMKKLSLI